MRAATFYTSSNILYEQQHSSIEVLRLSSAGSRRDSVCQSSPLLVPLVTSLRAVETSISK
jgi:hypothetical protein